MTRDVKLKAEYERVRDLTEMMWTTLGNSCDTFETEFIREVEDQMWIELIEANGGPMQLTVTADLWVWRMAWSVCEQMGKSLSTFVLLYDCIELTQSEQRVYTRPRAGRWDWL